MSTLSPDPTVEFDKVVIHLENEVIKGYLETRPADETLDSLLQSIAEPPRDVLRVRLLGDDVVREIPVEQTKAIFYVKEFDGDPQHKNLRFYKGAPIVHGLWIRLEFIDGEIMEGLVRNTIRFMVDSGFFLRPTDPYSNNRLVYVVKRWLKECRVLGLRNV